MYLFKQDGKVYNLDSIAFNKSDDDTLCGSCYNSFAHAIRTCKPPVCTLALYVYGFAPSSLPELSVAEEISTSVNIVVQVVLNLKPLAGISVIAAKGHAISLSLTGVQSLATVVYELPRQDLCEHIWLVVVAKNKEALMETDTKFAISERTSYL